MARCIAELETCEYPTEEHIYLLRYRSEHSGVRCQYKNVQKMRLLLLTSETMLEHCLQRTSHSRKRKLVILAIMKVDDLAAKIRYFDHYWKAFFFLEKPN